MAGTIVGLRTRQDRLRADQADVLRQALLPFAVGDLATVVSKLIANIDRDTASTQGWTFVMLSPSQNAAVVNYLVSHSSRPLVALRVWALCFEHLRMDTGEIALSRDEIADAVHEFPDNISAVMSELVEVGAIIRRRERIAGVRGPGRVRYFMNPRVGTCLTGRERDTAQQAAPTIKLATEAGQRVPRAKRQRR